jgi:hypothetical protein
MPRVTAGCSPVARCCPWTGVPGREWRMVLEHRSPLTTDPLMVEHVGEGVQLGHGGLRAGGVAQRDGPV